MVSEARNKPSALAFIQQFINLVRQGERERERELRAHVLVENEIHHNVAAAAAVAIVVVVTSWASNEGAKNNIQSLCGLFANEPARRPPLPSYRPCINFGASY